MPVLPLIGLVAIATIIPSVAFAQNVTVDALSTHLTIGQVVTITEINGNRSQGRITDLTGSTIVLRLDSDEQRSLSASTVRRVDVKDSLLNGALIGFAAGAVPGAVFGNFVRLLCESESGRCDAAPVVAGAMFGAFGAGLGAGIDALIRRSVTVSPNHPKISVAPLIEPRRRGLMMSVRF